MPIFERSELEGGLLHSIIGPRTDTSIKPE